MAVVQISNIPFNASTFAVEYGRQRRVKRANIFASDTAITGSERARRFLGGEGTTLTMRDWNTLSQTASQLPTDNPSDTGTTDNLTAVGQVVHKMIRAQGWSVMDLVEAVTGANAEAEIAAQTQGYWQSEFQRLILRMLVGIFADNAANDSGDLIHNVYVDEVVANVDDENLLTLENFVNATAIAGEGQIQDFIGGAMLIHPIALAGLRTREETNFVPASITDTNLELYQNMLVVPTTDVPVTPSATNGNATRYRTYLVKPRSILFDEVPYSSGRAIELDRAPAAGNGGGQWSLWTRRQFTMHVAGFSINTSGFANSGATDAQLQLAASWDRVFQKENCGVIALDTAA